MRIAFCIGVGLGAMALTWIIAGYAVYRGILAWYLFVLHSHDGQIGLGAIASGVWIGGLCALISGVFAALRSYREFDLD